MSNMIVLRANSLTDDAFNYQIKSEKNEDSFEGYNKDNNNSS